MYIPDVGVSLDVEVVKVVGVLHLAKVGPLQALNDLVLHHTGDVGWQQGQQQTLLSTANQRRGTSITANQRRGTRIKRRREEHIMIRFPHVKFGDLCLIRSGWDWEWGQSPYPFDSMLSSQLGVKVTQYRGRGVHNTSSMSSVDTL